MSLKGVGIWEAQLCLPAVRKSTDALLLAGARANQTIGGGVTAVYVYRGVWRARECRKAPWRPSSEGGGVLRPISVASASRPLLNRSAFFGHPPHPRRV